MKRHVLTVTDLASPSPPTPAETILGGKYSLGPVIGSGGMGTVYRGTHVLLGRAVAVKLMHPSGDPLMGERFLREGQVAAAARHPNVVDILDFGTSETGQPFMVMELLEGRSLREVIEEGPALSLDDQIDIFAQILAGLDAVHRAGIVHRDIKPANVFLGIREDGTWHARLLDFGISFSIDPGSRLRRGQFGTDARLVIGTPEYMSLEQCEGRPDVDARADVHAMAVLMYEVLTGEMPYSDPNPGAVLYKVITGKHTPLVELRPDIPEIAAVIEEAMSSDRDARPASARIFRRRLMEAAGRPVDPGSFRSLPPLGPSSIAPSVSASQTPARAALALPLEEPEIVIELDEPVRRRARPRGIAVGLASLATLGACAVVMGGWVSLPTSDVVIEAIPELVAHVAPSDWVPEPDVVLGAAMPAAVAEVVVAPTPGPSIASLSPLAAAPVGEPPPVTVAEPVVLEPPVTEVADAPVAARARGRRVAIADTRIEPVDLPPPVEPVREPDTTDDTLTEVTADEIAAMLPTSEPTPIAEDVVEVEAAPEAEAGDTEVGRELDF